MADSEQIKLLKRRLAKARRDRDMRAPFINEVYRLAMPQRERIGASKTTPMTEDEIQDILDLTFAETSDDFASDMIATFTPPHEPWVKHAPSKAIPEAQRKQIAGQIKSAVDWFWEDVEASNYYDAADECFHDLVAGTMAIRRLDYGAAQPICYEPIPTSQLLIDKGPDLSAGGRFTEGKVDKMTVQANYGQYIDPNKFSLTLREKWKNAKEDTLFNLVDGVSRVWDKPGMTQWRRVVMLEGDLVYEKIFDEDGAETIYVARWRTESNSAYGIGPGWWPCAPARVLNELNALVLAQMHNVADPAHAYSDPDGGANFEQGISAGDWLRLGEGFEIEKISGDGEFNAPFYTREDLRMMIKHALYQDKPEQRGDTPPTATQWADESARAAQRWEIPRGKITREWVVPLVVGHQWQRTKHGIFPEIKLGSTAITLKPQSPQAKARSFEKVAKAERVLATTASPALQQTAVIAIDGRATIENIKNEIGDDIVVVRTQEEVQQVMQQAQSMAQQQEEAA